ncbi:ROK family protein [Sulfurimonas sp.]
MILGVDIGGTYIRYEIKDKHISLKKALLKSTQLGLSAFLDNILQQYPAIDTVCIAYAGQVQNGVILSAPNINIDKKNIKAYIEAKYKVKLFLQNDVNCAVLAESALYKSGEICAVYIGTGLGLGAISNNTLLKGAQNIATELGHIPYKETPFTCNCGKTNCIELFCSGSGLDKWKKYYNLDTKMTLQELKESKCNEAQEIYNEFFQALLHALGIVVTLFNPKILVLGGGINLHNKNILVEVKKNINHYALPLAAKNVTIVHTQLKDAALEGAFLLKEKYPCQKKN